MLVEVLSNLEALGQRLDIEIQDLSRHCPLKKKYNKKHFLNLDIVWTNIRLGLTLEKDQIFSVE